MSHLQTAVVENTTLSQAVVEAVAEAEGTEPVELTPPLYKAVDPDALDELFAATRTEGRMAGEVTFSYKGYEVTACGDGYVSVEERE